MADQNLLNDDDFFSKALESLDDKPKDKKDEVYSEEDNLFKPQNLDEQSAEELAYIESSLQERSDSPTNHEDLESAPRIEDKKQSPQMEKQTSKENFEQASKPSQGELNYKQVYFDMDDEQEKVSYKPFFIVVLILIIVGVGGYFAYDLYLKDNVFSKLPFFVGEQPVEQPVIAEESEQTEQPEKVPVDNQPQLSPLEKQKIEYISKLAGKTNQDVNSISSLISVSSKSTKLSGIVVYDSDFILEVFGKSQQDLARLNNELKNSNDIKNLKMVSSSERIGANNGVMGVYSAKLTSVGSVDKKVTLNLPGNTEAGNWLKSILTNNKLKVTKFKNRSTKTQDVFKVHEIEATANGSINSCLSALNALAAAGTNVKLHKLTFSAIDQTNFESANYQIKLVLKFYV
jgi:hypothetical protein